MNKMKRISWLILILYYLAGLLFLIFYNSGLQYGTYFTQPLFMPLLILYYFTRIRTNNIKPDKWLIIAVIFSWFGDLTMMFTTNPEYRIMVLPGIISFLLMHLTYIKMFYEKGSLKKLLSARLIPVLFFIGLGIALNYYLSSYFINDKSFFKIPVLIYSCIIVSMVIVAVLREAGKRSSFFLIAGGALCFLFSDASLSIHIFKGEYFPVEMFSHTFYLSWAVVGITYVTAQLLIVEGLIRSRET